MSHRTIDNTNAHEAAYELAAVGGRYHFPHFVGFYQCNRQVAIRLLRPRPAELFHGWRSPKRRFTLEDKMT